MAPLAGSLTLLLGVWSSLGATVDFVNNGFLPRPSLRNAKLRPGLTY